jgi:hypothetical protein
MFSVVAKLTGEFTSLEEPTNDSDIAIVAVLLADGSGFIESESQIEPDRQIHLLIQACEDWREGWCMKLKTYGPKGYLVSVNFRVDVG